MPHRHTCDVRIQEGCQVKQSSLPVVLRRISGGALRRILGSQFLLPWECDAAASSGHLRSPPRRSDPSHPGEVSRAGEECENFILPFRASLLGGVFLFHASRMERGNGSVRREKRCGENALIIFRGTEIVILAAKMRETGSIASWMSDARARHGITNGVPFRIPSSIRASSLSPPHRQSRFPIMPHLAFVFRRARAEEV